MPHGNTLDDIGEFFPALVVLLQNAVDDMFSLDPPRTIDDGSKSDAVNAVHQRLDIDGRRHHHGRFAS